MNQEGPAALGRAPRFTIVAPAGILTRADNQTRASEREPEWAAASAAPRA
jgi:hypothetical protein